MSVVATASEVALAKRYGLAPESLAAARAVLNTIASLPWPEPERVSLLARLAKDAHADVGTVLARLALSAAPLRSFDELIPLFGIADKRTFGLAKALAPIDVKSFGTDEGSLRNALNEVSALRNENEALRAELDRLSAQLGQAPSDQARRLLRIGDIASSVSSQVAAADDALRARAKGLQLGHIELMVHGRAAAVGDDVALDFASAAKESAVGFRFSSKHSASVAQPSMSLPSVLGYTAGFARRKLEALGFSVAISELAGSSKTVSEQFPAAGALLPAGSLVRVVVR